MDTKRILYNYFSDEEFVRISKKIRDIEEHFFGEVKVAIRVRRPWFRFWKSPEYLARNEFTVQTMKNSEKGLGILIYILLNHKQFFILTDKSLREKIDPIVWDEFAEKLKNDFLDGFYAKGLLNCIESIGKVMSENFSNKEEEVEMEDEEIIEESEPKDDSMVESEDDDDLYDLDYDWLINE